MVKYKLTITPAIEPKDRHRIEIILESMGYYVIGGGQRADGTVSDISFNGKIEGKDDDS